MLVQICKKQKLPCVKKVADKCVHFTFFHRAVVNRNLNKKELDFVFPLLNPSQQEISCEVPHVVWSYHIHIMYVATLFRVCPNAYMYFFKAQKAIYLSENLQNESSVLLMNAWSRCFWNIEGPTLHRHAISSKAHSKENVQVMLCIFYTPMAGFWKVKIIVLCL